MAKKYEHNDLIKLLTILGGLVGLALCLLALLSIENYSPSLDIGNYVVSAIVGLVISVLVIITAMRPDDPFPWHWLMLFVWGILLIVFSGLWGGVLVIIAALIGLIDDL